MSEPVAIPRHLLGRPRDPGGFVIPWFSVVLPDGTALISKNNTTKRPVALAHRLCWTCGEPLGRFVSFVLSPAQTLSRTITELPSHVECNEYALKTCPFLVNPKRGRSDAEFLERMRGYPASKDRTNPGLWALWVTKSYAPASTSRDWRTIRVGDPERVEWWREGRPATAAEVLAGTS